MEDLTCSASMKPSSGSYRFDRLPSSSPRPPRPPTPASWSNHPPGPPTPPPTNPYETLEKLSNPARGHHNRKKSWDGIQPLPSSTLRTCRFAQMHTQTCLWRKKRRVSEGPEIREGITSKLHIEPCVLHAKGANLNGLGTSSSSTLPPPPPPPPPAVPHGVLPSKHAGTLGSYRRRSHSRRRHYKKKEGKEEERPRNEGQLPKIRRRIAASL